MPPVHVANAKVHEVLQTVNERQRLTTLVKAMAEEIERLDEDNLQLRAAISVYREALRRYACQDGGKAQQRYPRA